jgi:hypothetical protein
LGVQDYPGLPEKVLEALVIGCPGLKFMLKIYLMSISYWVSRIKIHAKDLSNVHSSQFLQLLEYEFLNPLWGGTKGFILRK